MKNLATEQINFWGLAVTIICLILLSFFVDIESMKEIVLRAGIYAPILFVLLKASTIIIAPLSGSPIYVIAGILFGFWPGLIYMIIGDTIGYSVNFLLARFWGQKMVLKMINKNEGGIMAKIVDHVSTTRGFFHMCLTCFAIPELIAYSAGLSKLSYWKFIGILVPISAFATAVLVFIGTAFSGSDKSLWATVGIPAVGMIVVIIGGWLFIKEVKKKDSEIKKA